MTNEQSPLDEAKRRILALWARPDPPTRGRPPKVSRGQVVDAAIRLADAGGLDAASMRSVARELGVGAMTLYTHVGSQRELVDAMADAAYAEFQFADDDAPWRQALEQHAHALWKLFRAHPWLADINSWRLPLGPHVFAVEDAGYRTIVDTGLSGVQVTEVLAIVTTFVSSHARSVATEENEARAQGVDYETYWKSTSEFWENYFDPSRYPTITRLWSSGAFDASPGPSEPPLDGVLDIVGLLIEQATADGGTTIPSYDDCMASYEADVARQKAEFESD